MDLKASFLASGLTTRVHRNTKHACSEVWRDQKPCQIHWQLSREACHLPGRIPGYNKDTIQLLPSSTTKKVSQQFIAIPVGRVSFSGRGEDGRSPNFTELKHYTRSNDHPTFAHYFVKFKPLLHVFSPVYTVLIGPTILQYIVWCGTRSSPTALMWPQAPL